MTTLTDEFSAETLRARIAKAVTITTLCPDPVNYDPFVACYVDFDHALTEEQCDLVRQAFEAYQREQSDWFEIKPELTDFVVQPASRGNQPIVSFTFTFNSYLLGQEIRRVTH